MGLPSPGRHLIFSSMSDASDISRWLVEQGSDQPDMRRVFDGLIERLHGAGIPISRLTCGEMTLHPETLVVGYRWNKGEPMVRAEEIGHYVANTDGYLNNPFRLIYDGEDMIRRPLTPDAALDFPILDELREGGHTDYLALGMIYGNGQRAPIGLCVDRPGGFRDEEIALLRALVPALRLVAEIHANRRLSRELLNIYLGHDASRQVLEGHVRRGDAQDINAVIWFCDLRGFTSLSDRLPRDFLIHVLNDYFTAMGDAIHEMDGEILKFVGDAVMAIFRVGEEDDPATICEQALTAAELAMSGMRRLNRRREQDGKPALNFGLSLHIGEVTYGNIGAPSRLDFTVIGPAVNLAARLEKLAGDLGLNLITSADFAAASTDKRLQSIGKHPLKGITEPQAVYTLQTGSPAPNRADAGKDQTSAV